MFPFSSFTFKPDSDIPPLNGKTIVITGANSGLGYESLIHLAKHSPTRIYLCARSKEKYDTAMKGISAAVPDAAKFVHFLELDLQSLSAVKKAAQVFLAENDRLDILMNNAGIMAGPPALTADGYEAQFGTNHVGHALFTRELLPILLKTAKSSPTSDVRIINLSSFGHNFAPKEGFVPNAVTTSMSEYSTWTRYGQSKLANILFTRELARRHPELTTVAIHPGAVKTNLAGPFLEGRPLIGGLWSRVVSVFFADAATGALNQTWASVAPVHGKAWTKRDDATAAGGKEVQNGAYYTPVAKEGGETKLAKDPALAEKLWEWTESEFKAKGF